jgi:hypothetical protein
MEATEVEFPKLSALLALLSMVQILAHRSQLAKHPHYTQYKKAPTFAVG